MILIRSNFSSALIRKIALKTYWWTRYDALTTNKCMNAVVRIYEVTRNQNFTLYKVLSSSSFEVPQSYKQNSRIYSQTILHGDRFHVKYTFSNLIQFDLKSTLSIERSNEMSNKRSPLLSSGKLKKKLVLESVCRAKFPQTERQDTLHLNLAHHILDVKLFCKYLFTAIVK